MNNQTQQKVNEVAQRLSRYEVEALESRFEMGALPSSRCTSECGTSEEK